MNWEKLITLDNQFQADLLTDALGKAEIPFLVREYKDTAYDGLFVTQKGWGTIMVDETQLEEAKAIAKIDKNSLWRGLNIQKSNCVSRGFEHKSTRSWVCFGGFSAGFRGIFGVEVERGRFQRSGEARQAFLRLIRAHRFLPPRIPDLYD